MKKDREEKYFKMFTRLVELEKDDPAMKNEVFHTIDSLHGLSDVFDLFTDKLLQTELEFMKNILNTTRSSDEAREND